MNQARIRVNSSSSYDLITIGISKGPDSINLIIWTIFHSMLEMGPDGLSRSFFNSNVQIYNPLLNLVFAAAIDTGTSG